MFSCIELTAASMACWGSEIPGGTSRDSTWLVGTDRYLEGHRGTQHVGDRQIPDGTWRDSTCLVGDRQIPGGTSRDSTWGVGESDIFGGTSRDLTWLVGDREIPAGHGGSQDGVLGTESDQRGHRGTQYGVVGTGRCQRDITEKVTDRRLREETNMGEEQFCFMPGKGTTDAIFAAKQMIGKHRERQKELHMVFIDLEKAYDRVPRHEYVRIVKVIYVEARTKVKSSVGLTSTITVRVRLHQGSSLCPCLFDLVMDVLGRGINEQPPWCMLFADDIMLCSTRREEVERRTEKGKRRARTKDQ